MNKIIFLPILSLLSSHLFALSLCNDNIELGKKYNLHWKKESKLIYSNYSETKECQLYLDENMNIKKGTKHSNTKTSIINIPKTLSKMNFKEAQIITEIKSKININNFSKLKNVNLFLSKNSDKIKVISTLYSNEKNYSKLINVCNNPGINCSIDIEYGINKIGEK